MGNIVQRYYYLSRKHVNETRIASCRLLVPCRKHCSFIKPVQADPVEIRGEVDLTKKDPEQRPRATEAE